MEIEEKIEEKESFSSKIRKRFGWKRKIILEKERKDGTAEVTIEVPAKHEGMTQESSGEQKIDLSEKEQSEETNVIEKKKELDDCYVEVMTTLTSLFTPNFDEAVPDEDTEKVMFEDKLKCQNSDTVLDDTEKLCDIPVLHVPKTLNTPGCHTSPSYSWLSTQSYHPGSVFDEAMDTGMTGLDVNTALKEEIMDFEKEYKDVHEIVKKDHIKKSISILLESSKSY
eukprot:GFUD01003950.1.p1 GENE.GFUD01003950.1~~GFUD01003950.1.p1  ORF type:complete len:234 (+),score=85.30 GFUD01003950.1:28-702(+)